MFKTRSRKMGMHFKFFDVYDCCSFWFEVVYLWPCEWTVRILLILITVNIEQVIKIWNEKNCNDSYFIKYFRFLSGWKEWMCKGMMLAENDTWNKALNMKLLNMEILDNKLLEFLACSTNDTIIISYIDLLKSGYFTRAQDRIAVFYSIIARHAKNNLVFDYILYDLSNIAPG